MLKTQTKVSETVTTNRHLQLAEKWEVLEIAIEDEFVSSEGINITTGRKNSLKDKIEGKDKPIKDLQKTTELLLDRSVFEVIMYKNHTS